jgi:hypothetical protein
MFSLRSDGIGQTKIVPAVLDHWVYSPGFKQPLCNDAVTDRYNLKQTFVDPESKGIL